MRRATTTTTPATTSVSVPSRGAAAKRAGSNRSLATSAVKAAVGINEMPSLTVRGRARLVLREAVHVDAEGLVGDRRREDQRGQEALLCEARRERGGIEDLAGVHERDRGGDGHRGRAGQGHARQHELPRARIVRGGEEERHERAEARHRLHDATGDPDGEVGQHDRQGIAHQAHEAMVLPLWAARPLLGHIVVCAHAAHLLHQSAAPSGTRGRSRLLPHADRMTRCAW